MAKYTPSTAKNHMRRALWALVDPLPNGEQVDELWSYFESSCAYCGTRLDRDGRAGHLDHLVPVSNGGTNEIFNHVLACARCNGDDKREEPWELFLGQTVADPDVRAERRTRLVDWAAHAELKCIDESVKDQVRKAIDSSAAAFDLAVAQIRGLRERVRS